MVRSWIFFCLLVPCSEDSDLERYLLLNAESRQIERFEAIEGMQAKEKLGRDFWRPFRGD